MESKNWMVYVDVFLFQVGMCQVPAASCQVPALVDKGLPSR